MRRFFDRNYWSQEYWDQSRRRMIAETERYLEKALKDPRCSVVIPVVPVGSRPIPRKVADAFWHRVLYEMENLDP